MRISCAFARPRGPAVYSPNLLIVATMKRLIFAGIGLSILGVLEACRLVYRIDLCCDRVLLLGRDGEVSRRWTQLIRIAAGACISGAVQLWAE